MPIKKNLREKFENFNRFDFFFISNSYKVSNQYKLLLLQNTQTLIQLFIFELKGFIFLFFVLKKHTIQQTKQKHQHEIKKKLNKNKKNS